MTKPGIHARVAAGAVLMLLGSGCSTAPETASAPERKEAHSFNVIQAVDSSGGFLLGGYSDYKDSASQAMMPGAVLVVGVRSGVTLGGQRFDYGAVVLVQGDQGRPTFRQATARDVISLSREVSVFGRKLPKGPVQIPPGGTFAETAAPARGETSSGVSEPPKGEFSGTVTETAAAFEKGGLNFRLKLLQYPGLVLAVPRKVAIAAGLYAPKTDTVEDAKGWEVRVRCQDPATGPGCGVVSLKRIAH
jgi:hypothetical protein